ncbi:hypothetical protein ACVW0K_003733 [Streptomyces filamentosus]
MTETLIRPLADGFMQVGVFVALLVGVFAWLRRRYGTRLLALLERRRGFGPVVGALLGVSPGCAGALLLTPLYTRGAISFGTVVAGVAATMGDSSWVVFAAKPLTALKVHALLFATGLVTGYLVDALRLTPERLAGKQGKKKEEEAATGEESTARELAGAGARTATGGGARTATATGDATRTATTAGGGARTITATGGTRTIARAGASEGPLLRPVRIPATPLRTPFPSPASSTVPPAAAPAPASDPAGNGLTPLGLVLWVVSALAALVAVPVAFQLVTQPALARLAGGWDPYLVLGTLGTVLCGVFLLAHRGTATHDDDGFSEQPPSVALAGGARELSLIVVWVSAIYLVWSLVEKLTGFDGSQLPLHGWIGVVVGACIGLIPGCAVQIAFTTLYLAGGMPMPTLMANAVSQDGDALLPLIARDTRAAVLTTVLTTIPALVVGAGMLLLL